MNANKYVDQRTGLVAIFAAFALAMLFAGLPALKANANLPGVYAHALMNAADFDSDGIPDVYDAN